MWKPLPCVVTGDVRGSRDIQDREALQKKLNQLIEGANREFRSALLSPFRVTIGDEWQGLLQDAGAAFKVVRYFRNGLYPYRARFGVGEGELATALARDVTQMDGVAFHRSREALAEAKRLDRWLLFRMRAAAVDSILSSLAYLMEMLMDRWTDKQRERFFLLQKLGSQKAVAEHLGISLSAVNQSFRAAGAPQVLECESAIDGFLQAWGSGELATKLFRGS